MDNEYLDIFSSINGEEWLPYEKFKEFEKKGHTRSQLIRKYSFAVPNQEAIREIVKYSPIIEIGAGSGYWGYLINKYGGNIICFDNNERDRLWDEDDHEKYWKKQWYDIQFGDVEKIIEYPNRTLFLCWIEYNSKIGLKCLKKYKKKYFIHIGEGWGGCCATDDFFNYIEKNWECIKTIYIPQWHGMHDYLEIFKRK